MSQSLFPDLEKGDGTLQHLRPSIFELLAQEQLRDLLHPVVRYVLSYFTQRYPRYLLRILNHHEEFFACLLLILERHHLKKHNASLSEHFYSLRLTPITYIPTPRLNALSPSSPSNLSRKQRYSLLLFLVGIPYLRARLQSHYTELTQTSSPSDPSTLRPPLQSRLNNLFLNLYPSLNTTYELYLLSHSLSYLFNHTPHYRPWHKLFHIQIQRSTPPLPLPPSTQQSLLSRLPPLLPVLLLGLKLSQWWYSPNSPRTLPSQKDVSSKHARILPPRALRILPTSGLLDLPPEYEEIEGGVMEGERSTGKEEEKREGEGEGKGQGVFKVEVKGYGICPLCDKKWVNPSVLSSGWVVCWRCGWEAVEGDDEGEEGDDVPEGDDRGRDEVMHNGARGQPGGIGTDGASGEKRVKGRRGICPFTGIAIGPGELRRVLV